MADIWLVDRSFTTSTFIRNLSGPSYRMLHYPDGSFGFEHRCVWIDGDRKIVAPRLQLTNGHRVVSLDPMTIEPSILCPDCGTHGFIRDGRWDDAGTPVLTDDGTEGR